MRPNLYAVHKSTPPVHVLSQTNSCNINTGNHRLQVSVERESKSVMPRRDTKGTGPGSLANCYNIAGQLQHKKTVSLTGDSQTLDPIPNITIRFATTLRQLTRRRRSLQSCGNRSLSMSPATKQQ